MTEDRNQRRTRWIIYGLLVVMVVAGLAFPRVLRIEPSAEAAATYQAIANLREGSRVVLVADYRGADSERVCSVLLRQLLGRAGVVTISTNQDAANSTERLGRSVLAGLRLSYGQALINLGWRNGGYEWITRAARSFAAAADGHDQSGDDLRLHPLSQYFRSLNDADLLVVVWDDGQVDLAAAARLASEYAVGLVLVTQGDEPAAKQLWAEGRLRGLLSGGRAVTDYEALVAGRGSASRYLTAMSLATIFILLLIGWTYFGGVISRRRRGAGTGGNGR